MAVQVKVPALGESVTEAVLGTWLAKEGDAVALDQAIFELESDKANMEIAAEVAGTLKILKAEGDLVAEGDVVAEIDPTGAAKATPAAKSAGAQGAASPDKSAAPTSGDGEPFLSPAVRRIVAEKNLDPKTLSAGGPGGRITKADALAGASAPAAPAPAATVRAKPAAKPAVAISRGDRGERRVRMSRMRQLIARRLVDVQRTAAILTTFNEVDMSAVMALRSQHKEAFSKKHDTKLGFMSFFVTAAANALLEFRAVNGAISGDDVVYHNYCDIGVAVGGGKGLVVPVLRSAEAMSFAEVERTIRDFGARARTGKIR
ncbi:MAG: 2-oxo acid dehydrogenase subunit E2, partial [Deltaproteobacteria bacterium]